MPKSSDADGQSLSFTIARKPQWASFSTKSGRLYGTPDAGDIGVYSSIAITVSDGRTITTLQAFNIAVNVAGERSAALTWMPPTENADGSALTNLAGYRIYYGQSASTLNQSIVLDNPGLTRYVVEGLSSANWYFAMTSVNKRGVESGRSVTVRKTIG